MDNGELEAVLQNKADRPTVNATFMKLERALTEHEKTLTALRLTGGGTGSETEPLP